MPEHVVTTKNLAVQRRMAGPGEAVHHRDIHPPGPRVGIGQHGPVTPGHACAPRVLVKNQGQTRWQGPAHKAHFARFRIDHLGFLPLAPVFINWPPVPKGA